MVTLIYGCLDLVYLTLHTYGCVSIKSILNKVSMVSKINHDKESYRFQRTFTVDSYLDNRTWALNLF